MRILALCCVAVLIACAAHAAEPVSDWLPSPVGQAMGKPYYSGEILPTPKHADYGDGALTLLDGPSAVSRCALDVAYDGPARALLLRLLHGRIDAYTGHFPALKNADPSADAMPVLFALGGAEEAAGPLRHRGLTKAAAELPEQGYVLHIDDDGVLCVGADNAGVMNGMASFLQLMHVRDEKLVVRHATIRDWPTFAVRYVSEYHIPGDDFFDWMMLYKINGFATSYRALKRDGLTDADRANLQRIGDYVRTYGTMHYMAQFHIGGRGGRILDCGSVADVDMLLNTIAETMTLAQPQHVMICYDDILPELQPEAAKQFERPAQAHGAVMQRVYRAVKALDPDTVVSFCSPWYQGRGHRKWRENATHREDMLAYLADIRTWPTDDIRIVWTGPVTESRSVTMKDFDHYRSHVGLNHELFYWDNTWHYHQPLRNFHARYLDGFVDYCAERTSYVNINATSPIARFFAVTANDYYWNPDGFDVVRARQHAVAQFMGATAVPAAEAFYVLRGEDYNVFFTAKVDLTDLKDVFARLEETSIDQQLPQYCWKVYESIVKKQQDAKKK
ncbi:MAG: hypothetical protein GY851_01650 [bacterium]|nr:hypothetical protein [bacterium]